MSQVGHRLFPLHPPRPRAVNGVAHRLLHHLHRHFRLFKHVREFVFSLSPALADMGRRGGGSTPSCCCCCCCCVDRGAAGGRACFCGAPRPPQEPPTQRTSTTTTSAATARATPFPPVVHTRAAHHDNAVRDHRIGASRHRRHSRYRGALYDGGCLNELRMRRRLRVALNRVFVDVYRVARLQAILGEVRLLLESLAQAPAFEIHQKEERKQHELRRVTPFSVGEQYHGADHGDESEERAQVSAAAEVLNARYVFVLDANEPAGGEAQRDQQVDDGAANGQGAAA
mmetsp:Transcript_73319/g.138407  ORF Transcript_73319/g.138407 Transcript_73319/m.138407 type:complete len:285 (-) Transcript_73319:306-1160(-)